MKTVHSDVFDIRLTLSPEDPVSPSGDILMPKMVLTLKRREDEDLAKEECEEIIKRNDQFHLMMTMCKTMIMKVIEHRCGENPKKLADAEDLLRVFNFQEALLEVLRKNLKSDDLEKQAFAEMLLAEAKWVMATNKKESKEDTFNVRGFAHPF